MTATTDIPAGASGDGAPSGVTPDKPTVDLPADAVNWIALIRDCDSKIKDLEEAKALARKHIEAMLGEYELGRINGREAVRWTVVPSSRLDVKKLQAERPEVAAAFMRTSISRRFTLVDP